MPSSSSASTSAALGAARPAATASDPAARRVALLAGAVFVAFGVFTLWVMSGHGVLGFLTLAGREPWALQLFLDLIIAGAFGCAWLVGDARRRGLNPWPYVALSAVAGSPGLLVYAIRRSFTPRPGT